MAGSCGAVALSFETKTQERNLVYRSPPLNEKRPGAGLRSANGPPCVPPQPGVCVRAAPNFGSPDAGRYKTVPRWCAPHVTELGLLSDQRVAAGQVRQCAARGRRGGGAAARGPIYASCTLRHRRGASASGSRGMSPRTRRRRAVRGKRTRTRNLGRTPHPTYPFTTSSTYPFSSRARASSGPPVLTMRPSCMMWTKSGFT